MSLRSQSDDVFIVLAYANLPDPPMTLDEKRKELTAARRLIQTKYDAGILFFTKICFETWYGNSKAMIVLIERFL